MEASTDTEGQTMGIRKHGARRSTVQSCYEFFDIEEAAECVSMGTIDSDMDGEVSACEELDQ